MDGRASADVLLLEIAVSDVVVTPVGHRVELQAMGKLHLVGLSKLLKLLPPLAIPLGLVRRLFRGCWFVGKVEFLKFKAMYCRVLAEEG